MGLMNGNNKADIWIQCTCESCGGMIGYWYKNANTIARIKRETNLWRYLKDEGITVCQDCLIKIKSKGAMQNEKEL